MNAPPSPSGLLIIDKDPGFTSMDVCAIIRARLRRGGAPKRVKVGHAGTLDPMATGVLVVLVGKGTRLCDQFMADQKVYESSIDLSRRSTTDDAEGEITPVSVGSPPTRDQLDAAILKFRGTIQQAPPAFSAVHVGGRRAYELAREGRAVELKSRPVHIYRFEVITYEWPVATVRIECGKGTYIRSIARDLGEALGTGGMLTALRRTRSGSHDVSAARTLAAIPDVLTESDLLRLP